MSPRKRILATRAIYLSKCGTIPQILAFEADHGPIRQALIELAFDAHLARLAPLTDRLLTAYKNQLSA